MKTGTVIKSTGSWFYVKSGNGVFQCKIKGKFRIKGIRTTNPVVVGDIVDFQIEGRTKVITRIYDRKNYIIRKSTKLSKESQIIAANIELAALIVTINYPLTLPAFIDRFLVSAEAYRIPAALIFNKSDKYNEREKKMLNKYVSAYELAGYKCLQISALRKKNINAIIKLLKNKTTVLAGHSGVGKSTLINLLNPALDLKIGKLSTTHKAGKHTTTFAEMHELPFGGYIIDTPGIRGFGVIDIEKDELYHFFPEIFKNSHNCKYYNCTHAHEPDCAVKSAVDEKKISLSRYNNYLSMLFEENNKYRTE